jgi:hypothetical protein
MFMSSSISLNFYTFTQNIRENHLFVHNTYLFELGPVETSSFSFEKTCILQIAQCGHLLITIARDECPFKLLEHVALQASLRNREQTHESQYRLNPSATDHLHSQCFKDFLRRLSMVDNMLQLV